MEDPIPIKTNNDSEFNAGVFSVWLSEITKTLNGEGESDVPCGSCAGCCSSSYFIHITPNDKNALAAIPKKLLFAAPGQPKGYKILGHDAKGCCPMLIDGKCSIYENRPTTCRSYDCRIFSAAGILAGDESKELINQRVRNWSFQYPSAKDKQLHKAVIAAAQYLAENASSISPELATDNPTQLAMLAIKFHKLFIINDTSIGDLDKSAIAAKMKEAFAR